MYCVFMKQSKIYIYGRHAVCEALENTPQAVRKVYIAPSQSDAKLRELVKKTKVPSDILGSKQMQYAEGSAVHQGVIALISLENLVIPFKTFMYHLKVADSTAVVLLSHIQDPHNVGAVIRSSAAFGISGVLIPEHNQAPITGAVVKVSAGMAFRVPIVSIGNLNQAVRDLKEAGFTIYGLEGGGKQTLPQAKFDSPSVFILGNEGEGIRQKTQELCDELLSIPMHPRTESLNAAVSASVALYAWSSKHPEALKK